MRVNQAVRARRWAVPAAGAAAGYLLQLVGLCTVSAAGVAGGAVLGLLTEVLLLARGRRGLARRLARIELNRPARQLVRDGLLLAGLLRLDVLRPAAAGAWLLCAVLGCWLLHFLCQGVAGRVRRSRRMPFVTRNIDTRGLGLSPAPPRLFARQGAMRLTLVSAVVTAGAVLTVFTGDARWAAACATAAGAGVAAGTVVLGLRLLPGRRPVGEEEAFAWLERWLASYRPTVGLYFSGGTSSAYQADMWLPTLARLDGRPLVVLRERFMVRRIGATDVPVLCLPRVADLMRLEDSGLRVLLHPANSGKTSQVLRIPTIKHAFVNHGESDKLSSCNPYAKAYDEVWVAGPQARERYRLADVGVADEDVVEVGRPQLAAVRPRQGPPRGPYTTVLYAPTWEGWTSDPGNTSVVLAGERVVRELLADDGVRLLYKPHPMTGSVDPAAAAADRRIRALLAEANAARAAGQGEGAVRGAEVTRHGTGSALSHRAAELEQLTTETFRRDADETERMMRGPAGGGDRQERMERALASWEEAYWGAFPRWQHLVVSGPRPSVHACFNEADVLVSDISSVVSDHLASGKPYAVVNTARLTEDEFRRTFPTAAAATVVSPDAREIPALLHAVRDPAADTLAPAREQLRERLLGPADPPALTRFNRAQLALAARAEARQRGGDGGVGPRSAAAREDAEADSEAEAEAGSASDAVAEAEAEREARARMRGGAEGEGSPAEDDEDAD